MFEWFECKVKYEKTLESGLVKKTTDTYLVDAVNFTEAEKRITEEVAPFMTGEFQVADIRRARYAELFWTSEESADRWFKAKLTFITLDEKSGAEKKTSHVVLAQAADLRAAVRRIDEGMKGSLMDYTIASVAETPILDVYRYQEAAPEYMQQGAREEAV